MRIASRIPIFIAKGRPIYSLDLRFFVDAEDNRVLRWTETHPTMSVTFAANSRSVVNLNVSLRHGCTP